MNLNIIDQVGVLGNFFKKAMCELIRQNRNNSKSAFSDVNPSWLFGSVVLINKPGFSLVRKEGQAGASESCIPFG